MKSLFKIFIVIFLLFIQSCAKEQKETNKIKAINQQLEMSSTYEEAMTNMEQGDYFYSAKKFLESELLFPQSDWAPKSALMASYSYYIDDYYSDAIFHLERYMKTYPKDERMSYANFLLAMCYYESIVDEKKDLATLLKAKEIFQFIIINYPSTDFAIDANFKIDLIDDILASKEMYIGRHYIKKEKWIAAINRFKNVIDDYETTVYTEEALHRLVEIHYKIGLQEEAKKYASLLGYNYLSSEWYKKSYKIFNKKYETKKIKKEKNSLIKKFKKLF